MAVAPDPEQMSSRELDEYRDELARDPKREDSAEFHKAYETWEKSQ